MALAAMQRPDSPLRMALLSLGSALTLLVAGAIVIAALLRLLDQTVPREAPALLFHDVQTEQLTRLQAAAAASPGLQAVRTAPLVIGRLVAVNGVPLSENADPRRRAAATEQHELSHRSGNIDDVRLVAGTWWPDGVQPRPQVAFEDAEAKDLGVQVGDRLSFDIQGTEVQADLAAIFTQRRLQTRLWLEAMFSDGTLDPFVTRHVGAAWLPDAAAIDLQDRLARELPNVVTVRTQAMVEAARSLLGRTTAALAVVAGVCLLASLLVLAGVVVAGQARRAHEASVLLALGARASTLRRVLAAEFALLGLVTAVFAGVAGSLLAAAVLSGPLDLAITGLAWVGWATAIGVAAAALSAGGVAASRRLGVSPATLLRQAA
jgi:putative ABC transport system permease protein